MKAHFNKENERRLKKLTARQSGYNTTPAAHLAYEDSFARGYESGWNAAITGGHVGVLQLANMANATQPSSVSATDCHVVTPNGTKWYYC